jgi:hypothetical protein
VTHGGTAYTSAEHGVWWLVFGLGVGILVLGLLSTGNWASGTATRAAALFEQVDSAPAGLARGGGVHAAGNGWTGRGAKRTGASAAE